MFGSHRLYWIKDNTVITNQWIPKQSCTLMFIKTIIPFQIKFHYDTVYLACVYFFTGVVLKHFSTFTEKLTQWCRIYSIILNSATGQLLLIIGHEHIPGCFLLQANYRFLQHAWNIEQAWQIMYMAYVCTPCNEERIYYGPLIALVSWCTLVLGFKRASWMRVFSQILLITFNSGNTWTICKIC